MTKEEMYGAIEAILFTEGESVPLSKIAYAINASKEDTRECLLDMMLKYEAKESGIMILRFNDRYQMCTKPEYASYVERMNVIHDKEYISDNQMQVLAYIAYRQPVTKQEIDNVKGNDSASVLSRLIEMGLVEEQGRLQKRGRPIVYGTTEEFLRRFLLKDINSLPMLPDGKIYDLEEEAQAEIKKLL